MRWLLLLCLCAANLAAQKYSGPRPPKPDIPYLLHADNLVATEVVQAKEEDRKDEMVYTVEGASSPAKTPLASPIFLILADKLEVSRLQLYKLESKGTRREITFKKKKANERPLRLSLARVGQDNLYRLEVDESLGNGEYSLTPEGSNQVFCFQVY